MSPVKPVIAMHASSVPTLPHFPEADDCGGCLIGTDHRTQDFAVKLLDEYRGVGAVTEPHGELTAFSLRGAVGSSAGATAGGGATSTRQEASQARIPRGGRTMAWTLQRAQVRCRCLLDLCDFRGMPASLYPSPTCLDDDTAVHL